LKQFANLSLPRQQDLKPGVKIQEPQPKYSDRRTESQATIERTVNYGSIKTLRISWLLDWATHNQAFKKSEQNISFGSRGIPWSELGALSNPLRTGKEYGNG
jgi:hypothetical protein